MSGLLDQLKKEHRQVQSMLEEMTRESGTSATRRKELLSEFEREIQGHMAGEERVFYPLLQKTGDAKSRALESEEEHSVTKVLLGQLRQTSPDSERWLAKANVLKEMINHHIEEEENELFKSAQKILSKEDMEQMLTEYQQAKGRS